MPFWKKNTKAIVQGFVKNGVLGKAIETNHFMLECASICPETTHQKLESKRVYLTLLTMNLYVKICVCVASTILHFSRKLC